MTSGARETQRCRRSGIDPCRSPAPLPPPPLSPAPASAILTPVMLQTIAWTGSAVRLLDQTRLPTETEYVDITDERQMHGAIRRLVVRGAPAIGVATAFGVYLGVRSFRPGGESGTLLRFMDRLNEVCDYLATSRPTAVNLFWALDKMRRAARDAGRDSRSHDDVLTIDLLKARLLAQCQAM